MKSLVLCSLAVFTALPVWADAVTPEGGNAGAGGGGIDWFEMALLFGYVVGVFILLPITLYTNLREGDIADREDRGEASGKTLEERDALARQLLGTLEAKLGTTQDEEGGTVKTITSGRQSRLVKRTLDYINHNLTPLQSGTEEQVQAMTEMYEDRSQRYFSGSKWIIGAAVAVAVLMVMTGGVNTFIFIHALGLVFYILSSRVPAYRLEKIAARGHGGNLLSSILNGLFLGDSVRYYLKDSSGHKTRDWESEGQAAMIRMFLMAVAALFLGLMAALLGIVNFVLNYSTSFLLPFPSEEQWFARQQMKGAVIS